MAKNSALIEQTTRHAVYLERLKTGEANQFAAFLKRIDLSIRERLAGNELTEFSRTRLERLLVGVGADIKAVFDEYQGELKGHLQELGEYEAAFESRSLDNAIDGLETVIPAPAQITAAVFSKPLSVRGADGGKLLEPFIKDWTAVERKRLTGAIRQGYFEGQTTNQILQVVRGTRKNDFRDGLLNVTNRNAEAIVRTAVQHVASEARMATWQANDDVVTGYRWLSTLDGRTSPQCQNLDGQFFKFDEGPLPPIHIRCRSTTLAEIDPRYGTDPANSRTSMNGPVDGKLTYYEWLKTQPVAFQQDAIGIKRSKLLRDGGLSSTRFQELNLGKNFKPLSLKDMRGKEPLAFERAKL